MTIVKREHLLVAGTGRTGTSFIVRYLTGLGMDTHISRRGAASTWYDEANAGFEDTPLIDPASMPDVIKSPWSYEFVTELLARSDISLRGAIVPIRDLKEVAASRSILERQEIHARAEWMVMRDTPYETWGYTAGGVVFSLGIADQARLLAVGFHHLIQQLVEADVPIVLPSFPRLVEDPDYLFKVVRPVLPKDVDLQKAREVHAAVADISKVRVRPTVGSGVTERYPPESELDRDAMRRELIRVRQSMVAASQRAETTENELIQLRREMDALRAELAEANDRRGLFAWFAHLRPATRMV